MSYAQNTTVSPEKSRAEIQATIKRYGASHFAYAEMPDKAMVGFQVGVIRVRFHVSLPDPETREFTHKKTRSGTTKRTDREARNAWEKAVRQRSRALALCIKAKLESVEAQIETFEESFLAHIVLPGGQTIGDQVVPGLQAASVAWERDGKVFLVPFEERNSGA